MPYSLSILYQCTTGSDEELYFDLFKIWSQEELKEPLHGFFDNLMTLVNEVIKKYSASDDYGEYSKKQELWNSVSSCKEVEKFMTSKDARTILSKYTISKNDYKKRQAKYKQGKDLDFNFLIQSSEIFSNSAEYYKKLKSKMGDQLGKSEIFKLEKIIEAIQNKTDLTQSHVDFEMGLSRRIRAEMPELFDELQPKSNQEYIQGCNYLLKECNFAIENGIKVPTHFKGLKLKLEKKGLKYTAVLDSIGKTLDKGSLPSIKDVSLIGSLVS